MTSPDLAIPSTLSVVNFAYDDPMGPGYRPPTPGQPYWRDPDQRRVTVREVQAGADSDTKLRVYMLTMDLFRFVYDTKYEAALANNTVFRGGDVEHLLAELRGQLGSRHWTTK